MGDFGKLNFSVSFNRTSAFPLEANSYFTDLEQAEAAAKTAVEPGSADSTYYIGLTLTVADETDCNLYIIKPDLSLKQLTMLDIPDITWENILNKPTTIAGYGITDAYTKTESDDRYVNVSGDTMTGGLTLPNDKYYNTNGEFGLNLNNSDIIGLNGLYWRDSSDDSSEGINFYRDSSHWDTLFAKSGKLYFNPNRANEDMSSLGNEIWHAGNDGSGSGLDADTLDGYHLKYIWFTNNNAYIKLATIKISATYVNTPLEFRLNGRSGGESIITVGFLNAGNTDPGLDYFRGYGLISHYITRLRIYKSAVSTWEIWLTSQTQGHDSGQIYSVYVPTGMSFTVNNSPSNSLPSYTTYSNCNTASLFVISDYAERLNTPRTIWGLSFDGTQNINGTVYAPSYSGTSIKIECDANGNNLNLRKWEINCYEQGLYLQHNTSNNLLCCNGGGSVGIGTRSPEYKLDVVGDIRSSGRFLLPYSYGENSISLGNGDGGNFDTHNMKIKAWWGLGIHDYLDVCRIVFDARTGWINTLGKISAASGFYEESDIQLKTNIQPIDFTNNIELVSFNWKKDGSKSYGVIAQQVELYYPELVSTDESTGYKSVNYDAVLIIKCALLENRIKQLEKELEDLKYGQNCN